MSRRIYVRAAPCFLGRCPQAGFEYPRQTSSHQRRINFVGPQGNDNVVVGLAIAAERYGAICFSGARVLSALENLKLHASIERVTCIVLSRSDEALFWPDASCDQPFRNTRLIRLQKLLDRLCS